MFLIISSFLIIKRDESDNKQDILCAHHHNHHDDHHLDDNLSIMNDNFMSIAKARNKCVRNSTLTLSFAVDVENSKKLHQILI